MSIIEATVLAEQQVLLHPKYTTKFLKRISRTDGFYSLI